MFYLLTYWAQPGVILKKKAGYEHKLLVVVAVFYGKREFYSVTFTYVLAKRNVRYTVSQLK